MKIKISIIDLLICICLILIIFYNNIKLYLLNYIIKPNQYGNIIVLYFYNYALSISRKKDFINNINNHEFIKYFPTNIPFNEILYNKFIENNITTHKLYNLNPLLFWYCDKDWVYNLLKILRSTIHNILNEVLQKKNLNKNVKYPIIHFRCADVPFIKHPNYYLQKYSFFKKALEKYNFDNNKTVIIMYYPYHSSEKDNVIAANKYLNNLIKYISNLGYNCITQTKTPLEDFSDLFNAPFVISTGGSFSFMSGFFGKGKFISTEHRDEDITNKLTINNDTFLRNYNIPHKVIKSYYDVDDVENYRLKL
jgi:hypothetical protein